MYAEKNKLFYDFLLLDKVNNNIIIADVVPRAIMLISAKKSNGFDICNKYLSSKNAINGNPMKEVRRIIIKTGFFNSFFIFYHIFLRFYDFIIIAFLKIQFALNYESILRF